MAALTDKVGKGVQGRAILIRGSCLHAADDGDGSVESKGTRTAVLRSDEMASKKRLTLMEWALRTECWAEWGYLLVLRRRKIMKGLSLYYL